VLEVVLVGAVVVVAAGSQVVGCCLQRPWPLLPLGSALALRDNATHAVTPTMKPSASATDRRVNEISIGTFLEQADSEGEEA
jgi:hypothetical protein